MICVVSGGSGYVGRELIKNILNRGEEVINVDKSEPLEKIEGEKFLKCDLSDSQKTMETINTLDPQGEYIVIHLAGLFEKDMKKRNEWKFEDFLSMNTITTKNLIDELNRQKLNVESFIFSSAALVNCLGKIDDFYPQTKLQAEEHIKKSPPSPSTHILRVSRVVGGLDNGSVPKDIVSDFIKKILAEDEILLKGSNIQRDYIHIDDTCNVILSQTGEGVQVKNVYSTKQITIGRIIEMLYKALLDKGLIKEKKITFQEDTNNPLPRIEGRGDFDHVLKHKTSEDVIRKTIEEYLDAMEKKIPFN